jgi:hypothetical protein
LVITKICKSILVAIFELSPKVVSDKSMRLVGKSFRFWKPLFRGASISLPQCHPDSPLFPINFVAAFPAGFKKHSPGFKIPLPGCVRSSPEFLKHRPGFQDRRPEIESSSPVFANRSPGLDGCSVEFRSRSPGFWRIPPYLNALPPVYRTPHSFCNLLPRSNLHFIAAKNHKIRKKSFLNSYFAPYASFRGQTFNLQPSTLNHT